MKILKGLKSLLRGSPRRSSYTADAIKLGGRAVSARYVNDRKLPDKAIDVIDEAGAAQHLVVDRIQAAARPSA